LLYYFENGHKGSDKVSFFFPPREHIHGGVK
jgi:hypothetical protein